MKDKVTHYLKNYFSLAINYWKLQHIKRLYDWSLYRSMITITIYIYFIHKCYQ